MAYRRRKRVKVGPHRRRRREFNNYPNYMPIGRGLASPMKKYMFRQVVIVALTGAVGTEWNVSGAGISYSSTVDGGYVLNTSGAFGGIALQFRAFDLDNWASFAALFDQYKLERVKIHLLPTYTEITDTAVTPVGNTPYIQYAPDYDDLVAPTSEAYLRQYNTCKEVQVVKPIKITIIPRVETTAVSSSGIVASGNTRLWLDTSTSKIFHYGLKMGFLSAQYAVQMKIYAEYFIAFRNVR